MTPTLMDHLFVFLLVVLLPLQGAWQFRRLKERLAAGEKDVRIPLYRQVMGMELVLAGAALALWSGYGRPISALAPEPPVAAWWTWLGWGLTLAASGLLVVQVIMVGRSEEDLAQARAQLQNVAQFLPRTDPELRTFWALSLAAGVCEEVVYRGFALAWLAGVAGSALGMTGTAGVLVAGVGSSIIFGLAHAYQGPMGMVRTGAVGLGLAVLAVTTGGLLAPMIVHTVLDVTSGMVAHRALGTEPRELQPSPC